MGRTVEELLDTLSAAELADWSQFYAVEPWGSETAFLRTGIVTAMIANTNRNSKQRPEPYTPSDFMPDFTGKKRREKLDPKRVRNLLRSSFGRRVKKKDAQVLDRGSGGDPNPTPEDIGRDNDHRKR